MSTGLLMFGLALLVVGGVGPQVTVNGSQIGPGASWWQRALVAAVGVVAIGWAVLVGRGPVRELRAGGGFLGAAPGVPTRLVERPDLASKIVRAVRPGVRAVAVTGIGGAGKSTLAARVCRDRRLRRRFPDGVSWLEAGPGKDPVALLADLARRLGLSGAETGFTTAGQGRDTLAAVLRHKRVLVAVDNVWDRGPLDALIGLAVGCAVVFTTRLPELAATFGAPAVAVDELTREQALELLGRWTGLAAGALPDVARLLCARVGIWRWGSRWPGRWSPRAGLSPTC